MRRVQGLTDVLFDDEEGHSPPGIEGLDLLVHLFDHPRRQTDGWLVHEDHPGFDHVGPGQGEELLFPSREVSRPVVQLVLQDGIGFQDLTDGPGHLPLVAQRRSPHLQVLPDRQGGKDIASLGDEGNPPPDLFLRGEVGHVPSGEEDLPSPGCDQAEQGLEEG